MSESPESVLTSATNRLRLRSEESPESVLTSATNRLRLRSEESPRTPAKPTLDGIEARWAAVWDADGTYAFDRTAPRERVYAIDTPPPTVSGSLHVGHVFSFTQADTIARYQRMRGRAVFYPM